MSEVNQGITEQVAIKANNESKSRHLSLPEKVALGVAALGAAATMAFADSRSANAAPTEAPPAPAVPTKPVSSPEITKTNSISSTVPSAPAKPASQDTVTRTGTISKTSEIDIQAIADAAAKKAVDDYINSQKTTVNATPIPTEFEKQKATMEKELADGKLKRDQDKILADLAAQIKALTPVPTPDAAAVKKAQDQAADEEEKRKAREDEAYGKFKALGQAEWDRAHPSVAAPVAPPPPVASTKDIAMKPTPTNIPEGRGEEAPLVDIKIPSSIPIQTEVPVVPIAEAAGAIGAAGILVKNRRRIQEGAGRVRERIFNRGGAVAPAAGPAVAPGAAEAAPGAGDPPLVDDFAGNQQTPPPEVENTNGNADAVNNQELDPQAQAELEEAKFEEEAWHAITATDDLVAAGPAVAPGAAEAAPGAGDPPLVDDPGAGGPPTI